jgi:hypothetical protein
MVKWVTVVLAALLFFVICADALGYGQEKQVLADSDEVVVDGAWSQMKTMGGLNAVTINCQRRAAFCVETRVWDNTIPQCDGCGRMLQTATFFLRIVSWTSASIIAEDAGSCHWLASTLVIRPDPKGDPLKGTASLTMDNAQGKACTEKDKDPFMPQTWVLEDQVTGRK